VSGDGMNLCLSLDTRSMSRPHLGANSDEVAGTSSLLVGALQHADHSHIVDAGDVGIGQTDTRTMLDLEWAPDPSQTMQVVVWVHATVEPMPARTLQLNLIEQLED
jgi:hypothetical protein